MLDWLRDNSTLMWTLTGVSIAMFVGSLIVLPMAIAHLPTDYFKERKRPTAWWHSGRSWTYWLARIGKTALGVVFVLLGIAMLVLPGQGLLAILVGVMLIDFPGKFRFERWLVNRPGVRRALNWVRRKAHKPAFET